MGLASLESGLWHGRAWPAQLSARTTCWTSSVGGGGDFPPSKAGRPRTSLSDVGKRVPCAEDRVRSSLKTVGTSCFTVRMTRKVFWAAALPFLLALSALAQTFTATVVGISDADTITVYDGTEQTDTARGR